jgi:hypothetical protein
MLVGFGVDRYEVVAEGELTATEWLLDLATSSRGGGTDLVVQSVMRWEYFDEVWNVQERWKKSHFLVNLYDSNLWGSPQPTQQTGTSSSSYVGRSILNIPKFGGDGHKFSRSVPRRKKYSH